MNMETGKMNIIPLIRRYMGLLCMILVISSCSADDNENLPEVPGDGTIEGHLTTNNLVLDIVNHGAFKGFGNMLLVRDNNASYYNTRLTDVRTLMPYHSHVQPEETVGSLNRLIDDVNDGKQVFYEIYTDEEKQENPTKENAGLLFYRGEPGAPFAIIAPGGGFVYVGSLHAGFPLAERISDLGLNAFVLRYRLGSEQSATEDLAAAISYVIRNADELGVDADGYSIWGGSAGGNMVGNICMNGVAAYGGDDIPRPGTAVIKYTTQSSWSADYPPTFFTCAANDGSVNAMDRRAENLRNAGVVVEYARYRTAGHGFGLGTGSDAEGWLDLAVEFWKEQVTN
jgi:acetyl esterase/lipase